MRRPGSERAVECLERDEHPAHLRDRVDAEIGSRAVRGATLRRQLERHEASVRDADAQAGRLGHDGPVGAPGADERLGADAPNLLANIVRVQQRFKG